MEKLAELGINIPSFIAQIVNFGLLLGLLYLFAYKPILAKLDERSTRIKESMERTDQVKEQAQKAEEEFKKKIGEASQQGQLVIERAVKTGDEIRQKAIEEAKAEAEAMLSRARTEIRQERDEVVDQLRKEFAELTILAAGKVIDQSLDKKAHQALIDSVLENSTDLRKN
ncbi:MULTISPECIES: F0F1 ATP synthase subunit B [Dehalococcoides]|uniref:ATP synthase subunit b n=4 Tax=Dehalococcoides mccartyi TaxID=61435 RepID=ATPF_DEHMC|nr:MULTISPECIES: F0F1 ATP synthase subunit B [Dehalococcoides]A5FRQ1.1 RecName: Full=ATP synthase subunit b; AltName: Full=ATP synthase F(0) sector subunit b; AltName: Full=ATPase subunit I; AltName: Full=F-type ATPase subunit b; Short=F-ATPase subunit b [Dehalococcoides mccartyi BAV1]Q3ZZU1.1 RecName: Full=ATP synthase subunit b; AltName: Full=ATP synthase F(0) sector subunit b; AltName: Full=ATPase subunit I; AltName: Full=F-type ATPase subunit b; Short=F-ATPase subunit b [Dehalococcoides mccar